MLIKVSVEHFLWIFYSALRLFAVVGAMSESQKKPKSRNHCLSCRNRRKIRKWLKPRKGAKSAIWLHFRFRVVEERFVNDKAVEYWHFGSAVKYSGSITNLTVRRVKWHEGMVIDPCKRSPVQRSKRPCMGDVGFMARNASHFAANWPASRSNEFRQKKKKKWRRPTHGFLHLNLKSLVRQAHERSCKLMSFRLGFF